MQLKLNSDTENMKKRQPKLPYAKENCPFCCWWVLAIVSHGDRFGSLHTSAFLWSGHRSLRRKVPGCPKPETSSLSSIGHQPWISATFSIQITSGWICAAWKYTAYGSIRIPCFLGVFPFALLKWVQSGDAQIRDTFLPATNRSTSEVKISSVIRKWKIKQT